MLYCVCHSPYKNVCYTASVSFETLQVLKTASQFRDKGRSRHSVLLYGHGDGGGGPTYVCESACVVEGGERSIHALKIIVSLLLSLLLFREDMLESLQRMKDVDGLPKYCLYCVVS